MKKSPKRLNQFITEVLAIEAENGQEASQLAFMARALVMATLPHSKPGDDYFERKSGHYTLSMTANPKFGLPYGSIPRMLLAWMTTYAVNKASPEIPLGNTLTAFLKKLNLCHGGGKRGNATRVQNQMMRLLTCQISCVYHDNKKGVCEGNQFNIGRSFKLLWNPANAKQNEFLPDSKIILSQDFFEALIQKSIPINFKTLTLLRQSPLQMDIYVWLTYRFFSLKKETHISWKSLSNQFGSNYANEAGDKTRGARNFKSKFLLALKKVWMVYPTANLSPDIQGLTLYPSDTHVKKAQKRRGTPVDNLSYPR
jgi:hypothetical protein